MTDTQGPMTNAANDPENPRIGAKDGGRRKGFFAFLTVRSNRREYWLSIGLALALALALGVGGVDAAGSWLTVVVIFAQIRRLHDFDRTGWWAIAAQGAGLAVTMAAWPLSSMEIGLVIGGS